MIRKLILAGAMAGLFTVPALADQIEGNWRTGSGGSVQVYGCGGAYCIKVTAGEHSGRQIGKLSKNGDKYTGTYHRSRERQDLQRGPHGFPAPTRSICAVRCLAD
jgi:uncharacterized protein (DUF2147 family)